MERNLRVFHTEIKRTKNKIDTMDPRQRITEIFKEPNARTERYHILSPINRYQPYPPHITGERHFRPLSPTVSAFRESNERTENVNPFLRIPASQSVAIDKPSIVVFGTFNYGNSGTPVIQVSKEPDFQIPRQQSQTAPSRTERCANIKNAPEIANAGGIGHLPNSSESQSPSKKRVPSKRLSPTPRRPKATVSQGCQTVTLKPVQATASRDVRKSHSVAIKTNSEAAGSIGRESRGPAPTSTSKASEATSIDKLIEKVTFSIGEQIRGRCGKNFNSKSQSDRKRLTEALVKAKNGIKPHRGSFREILELFSVIDANNFSYELDRLRKKNLEKEPHKEKEAKLERMVKELNGLEKRLVELDAKIKEKTPTESERAEYDDCATKLGKKYFEYQKLEGTECSVLSDMHAGLTQKFDFSGSEMAAFPTVQHALEKKPNANREQFLKLKADLDSVCTPEFSHIHEIVSDDVKSHNLEKTEDEIDGMARGVYADIVKETKSRCMEDLWESLLKIVHCPSMNDLEMSDPANNDLALAEKLEKNDAVASQRFRELMAGYSKSYDFDAEMGEELGCEDTLNLEDAFEDDDIEDSEEEQDQGFVVSDDVVPIEIGTDFLSIFEEMQEISGERHSLESPCLPLR